MKSQSIGSKNAPLSNLETDCFGDKVIFLIFKLMGLAPLLIVRIRKERNASRNVPKALTFINFAHSNLGNLYNAVLIVLFFGQSFVSLPMVYDNTYPYKSKLTDTIELMQAIFGQSVVIFVWLFTILKQKTMVKILNRLMSVDPAIVASTESCRNYVVSIFLTNATVWIGVMVTESEGYATHVLSWMNDIVPGMIVSWFIIQYVVMIKLIEKKIGALNRALADVSRSSIVRPIQSLILDDFSVDHHEIHTILTFRRAHTELHEVSCEIAEFYSLPMVLMIGLNCYSIIYNTYFGVMPIVLSVEENTTLIVVNAIFGVSGRMLPIAMLAFGINRTTAQIGKTAHAVHELLSKSILSREDKFQLKAFSLELLHREVQFTACGLFPLDCTLVHSIFGMVVTYLIILYQFQMTSSCNRTHSVSNATTAKLNP